MSNVVEVKARGASVLALTTYPHREVVQVTAHEEDGFVVEVLGSEVLDVVPA